MYITDINGVTIEATLAILLAPPIMTIARITARAIPLTRGLMLKVLRNADAAPLAWTVVRRTP